MLEVGRTIPDLTALCDEYRGAMGNCILLGIDTDQSDTAHLITSGTRQTRPLAEVRRELSYGFPGMQVPGLVAVADGVQFLAEEVPLGDPLASLDRPLSARTTARLLAETAALIENAHRGGVTLFGVRPELVWADDWEQGERTGDLHIKGLTPRTMRFLLGMQPARGGLCLDDVYSPPEVWKAQPVGAAVDVFGLCALGYFLLTNRAPFPAQGDFNGAVHRVCSGAQPDWSGVELADVLAPGLAVHPGARPTLASLRTALG